MRVVIAGGHGQIALHLERMLAARGDIPVGIVRNAAQVAEVVTGADAVVFSAGAGPGSGAARKLTVDRDAAILLADAAAAAGVRRYVMVSAYGADNYDPNSPEVYQVYLGAKSDADAAIRARDLDWTIVRPGGLTNTPGTGRVKLADSVGRGSIPREDVATILRDVLDLPSTAGRQFEVVGGTTPIPDALASLVV